MSCVELVLFVNSKFIRVSNKPTVDPLSVWSIIIKENATTLDYVDICIILKMGAASRFRKCNCTDLLIQLKCANPLYDLLQIRPRKSSFSVRLPLNLKAACSRA